PLPLSRILGGHPRLLIVGPPGAGKTSALAYVAIDCARRLQDDAHVAHVKLDQKRLPIYLSLLALEPAAEAVKPDETEIDILDHLDNDEEGEDEDKAEVEVIEPLELENEDTENTTQEHGDTLQENPLERLIEAAIVTIDGSQAMQTVLKQGLEAGRAVVLIDGWADVAPHRRPEIAAWLATLIEQLPGNWWLTCAGERGYAPLAEIDFVPLEMLAWDNRQIEQFANRWAAIDLSANAFRRANVPVSDEERAPTFARQLTSNLQQMARAGASTFDMALYTFTYCVDGKPSTPSPTRYTPTYQRALNLLLPPEEAPKEAPKGEEKSWLTVACRQVLEHVALDLQHERKMLVNRQTLEACIEAALPVARELPARAEKQVFTALTKKHGALLRALGSDHYVFQHVLWQAYLAACQMGTLDEDTLLSWLDAQTHDPRLAASFRFYAEIGDITPFVTAWMRGQDDIFHTRLNVLSTWIRAAPDNAAWRNGAMAVLAKSFLQPHLPWRIRKALAQALVTTGMSGIRYLFKQALQHNEDTIRIAAAWGLSRVATEADIPTLAGALQDENPDVRETTVRGLANLGTDAAARLLARVLLEGDEALSLIAGEALGQCGAEGASILEEAIELEDVVARRAAVIGLAQLQAKGLLEKVAREDDQWIVRSAASAALEDIEAQKKRVGVEAPVELDQLPWLISWAASQGESVGMGEAARRTLLCALAEGDPPIRIAAAQTLAQVGRAADLEALQAALVTDDPQDNHQVISAVLEALARISHRYEVNVTSARPSAP
ncbi:MAG TPA: HEAT repeat domain-containing protein, partial [Chloroflexi bacterium]|nr:HEAT repeat domain-containing protein [Chloroflexota bacterium]